MTIRTAQLDADNRRDPNGAECYCVRCHKELKPGQARRWVVIEDWSFARVIHPEDTIINYDWTREPGWFPVGMDCAKKIGIEFTKELPI